MLKLHAGNILIRGGLAAFLAMLLLAGQVEAQGTGRSRGRGERGQATNQVRSVPLDDITRPLFIESDLGIIRGYVNVDDGQGLIIETLLADHVEIFNEAVQVFRVQLLEARSSILEPEEPEGARQEREAYESRMQQMRDGMTARLLEAETSEERLEIRMEFSDSMRELTRTYRSEAEQRVESLDWGAFLARQSELLRSLLETRRDLEDEFMTSSTLVLDMDQLADWDAAMQAVRRRDMTRMGVLGGESVDFVDVLDGMDLDPETRQGIMPMLSQYATAIDARVQQRTRFLHEAAPAISDTLAQGSWDRMRAIIQEEANARIQLRDENLNWFESFALVLPGATKSAFQEKVRLSQFGNVWRPGRLERMLEAASQMTDLTSVQRAALESMEQSCVGDMVSWKARMEAAFRAESPAQWVIDQQQRWSGSFNGAAPDSRIEGEASRAARAGMAKAEQACMQSLEELLGERYASLPGARSRPRQDGEGSRRSEESQRRRDELYKRFDRNGDGRLDADERDQMRREFQQERGHP